MSNSTEFLKDKLKKLYDTFSNIKIRYEYKLNTCSHLIEILPLSFFENNEEYVILEAEIEAEFETIFPDENIIFISEDSLSEIENPEFKLGYDIKFCNEVFSIDLVVEGFSDFVDYNNFAIAA